MDIMETIMILSILLFDGAFAYLFANIAKKKGYSIFFGILGFFFPILYLILLLLNDCNSKTNGNKNKPDDKEYIKIFFALIGNALILFLISYSFIE